MLHKVTTCFYFSVGRFCCRWSENCAQGWNRRLRNCRRSSVGMTRTTSSRVWRSRGCAIGCRRHPSSSTQAICNEQRWEAMSSLGFTHWKLENVAWLFLLPTHDGTDGKSCCRLSIVERFANSHIFTCWFLIMKWTVQSVAASICELRNPLFPVAIPDGHLGPGPFTCVPILTNVLTRRFRSAVAIF